MGEWDRVIPLERRATDNKLIEMATLLSLFLLFLLVASSCGCPFDPNRMPSALSCIQNIACVDSSSNNSSVIVQNCNKKWYYGSSSVSVSELTSVDSSSSSSFISQHEKATKLKATSSFALIGYNSSLLYHYPLGSSSFSYTLTPSSPFSDFTPLNLKNSSRMAILQLGTSVQTLAFDSSNNMHGRNLIETGYSLSTAVCLDDARRCIFGSVDGKMVMVDIEESKILQVTDTGVNEKIILIESKAAGKENAYKIYVVFSGGRINQYLISSDQDILLERSSSSYKGSTVVQIASMPDSPYLLITDTAGNASQINLSTGLLLDTINVAGYLSNKSSVAMSLLLNNRTSYYLYNTVNSVVFHAQVDSTSTTDQIVLSCFNMHFYDSQQQLCEPCGSSCTTCNPLSGLCSTCIGKYFNKGGRCLSCFYDSGGLTDHFQECFSQNEQTLMQTSSAVAQFLSVVVSNFATVMNICGLLFLFLKLINNWNIICLYFFPAIELPFFLQNILQMLFNNFNSSVLRAIGVDLTLTLGTSTKANNPKVTLMTLNTDFLDMNAESIILFLYSVVLTVTVYKFINYLLAKVNISIFEQNTAISIIEEFVGCFTLSALPLYFVMAETNVRNRAERTNLMLYYFLLGVIIVVPFCFLIFDHEYKLIRTNKVHNNDQNHIAESVNLGLTKRIKAWREDDSKESFFYALLSFTTALLACHPCPQVFIFGVGLVNLLCLLNAFTFRQRKLNIIIQKFSFFIFHACYSCLYYLEDGHTKFTISIFLVVLIVFIAVHELLLTVYKKVYFLYILIRGKIDKEARIETFFKTNEAKMVNKKRAHPICLPLRSHPQVAKVELQFTFNKFQVKVVKQAEKFILPKTAKDITTKKAKGTTTNQEGKAMNVNFVVGTERSDNPLRKTRKDKVQ